MKSLGELERLAKRAESVKEDATFHTAMNALYPQIMSSITTEDLQVK